jgi:ATP-dependent exoDNAse (exonuclease V) alpha subunit
MTLSPKMQALVEAARANHAAKQLEMAKKQEAVNGSAKVVQAVTAVDHKTENPLEKVQGTAGAIQKIFTATGSFHPTIPTNYNERQLAAIELAMRGKSFNLIGAAGTGKTTTTREIIGQLCRLPSITPLQKSTKYLTTGSPGIVVISFTNKAVNNLKKFLTPELQKHCLTYHKLLEYGPVYYDVEGSDRKTMRFEPKYDSTNPLPHISCIIVEESSMVSTELHSVLRRALPNPDQVQWIFLGDLNQLPPIFGPSILGFSLLDLQTVELTHVYRQALESPIITLAHKIREGRGIGTLSDTGFKDHRGEHGLVTLHPWKKKLEPGSALLTAQNFIGRLIDAGNYNPDEDMILCPFNKSFGTIELNRYIAQKLGDGREAEVFEVIARYTKSYWAVGDRVLVDRQEARIIRIEPTPGYTGAIPQTPSKTLSRWGKEKNAQQFQNVKEEQETKEVAEDPFDLLDSLVVEGGDEDSTNDSSHTITVEFLDSGATRSLSRAGDINGMLFSYVLTVHKSQGSEWKRVFILLHYSHNTMLSRELLYTAITRARHELFIICEPDRKEIYNSLTRAAKSPEISGVTLEEKAQYFRAKQKSMQKFADRNKGQQQRVG